MLSKKVVNVFNDKPLCTMFGRTTFPFDERVKYALKNTIMSKVGSDDKKIIFLYTKPRPRVPCSKISFYYKPIPRFEYPPENYAIRDGEKVFVIDTHTNKIYDEVVSILGVNKGVPMPRYHIDFSDFPDKNGS